MLEVIPAIDLSEGAVVRLTRGEFGKKTVYSDDPAGVARAFEKAGARRLHVVDLDGAKTGESVHYEIIRKIAAAVKIPLQVGGGMRTAATAKKIAGIPNVDRIILGTAAAEKPGVVKEILSSLGAKRVVLSVDVKAGNVATRGWLAETEGDPVAFGRSAYEAGVRLAIYTDVKQDGTLKGPNIGATAKFASGTGLRVIVAGGVSSLTDIELVKAENNPNIIGVIIGRAIYEGAVDLAEAVKLVS